MRIFIVRNHVDGDDIEIAEYAAYTQCTETLLIDASKTFDVQRIIPV